MGSPTPCWSLPIAGPMHTLADGFIAAAWGSDAKPGDTRLTDKGSAPLGPCSPLRGALYPPVKRTA